VVSGGGRAIGPVTVRHHVRVTEARSAAEVRPALARDAEAIARVYRPHVESSYASFEEIAPDADEMRRRMASARLLPWFVACEDGEVVGFAFAAQHRTRPAYRWTVDCSVYLDGAATGRGLGRALYAVLLPALRDLGYCQAFAGIAQPNEASVRLHESFGFGHLGTYRDVGFKIGAWRDVAWYQLTLSDPPAVPAEPRSWDPAAP
jgi:phosphinothricin acetyltransferase